MPSAQDLLVNSIRPALEAIGLPGQAGEQLLLGTAAQESNLDHRRQLGGGPGRGLFQMEPATHNDIWANYLKFKRVLAEKVASLLTSPNADKLVELERNDRYAAAMARVHYLRVPKPLPAAGDLPAMAQFWKDYYNTAKGAGTPEQFLANWQRYVEGRGETRGGIGGSVGRRGKNQPADVGTVQDLLRKAGFDAGPTDRVAGPRTIQAILAFQSQFLRRPDGLIEPDGQSLQRLMAAPGSTHTGAGDVAGGSLTWPLATNLIRRQSASNTFGMVRHYENGQPKPHQGWDLEAAIGTPIYAIGAGRVAFATSAGDYGVQVCISFTLRGRVLYAFYAHLSSATVQAGQLVAMNQVIGRTGNSGNASNLPHAEDHLHFEVRTTPHTGLGLGGRVSPIEVFGSCPLHSAIMSPKPA